MYTASSAIGAAGVATWTIASSHRIVSTAAVGASEAAASMRAYWASTDALTACHPATSSWWGMVKRALTGTPSASISRSSAACASGLIELGDGMSRGVSRIERGRAVMRRSSGFGPCRSVRRRAGRGVCGRPSGVCRGPGSNAAHAHLMPAGRGSASRPRMDRRASRCRRSCRPRLPRSCAGCGA